MERRAPSVVLIGLARRRNRRTPMKSLSYTDSNDQPPLPAKHAHTIGQVLFQSRSKVTTSRVLRHHRQAGRIGTERRNGVRDLHENTAVTDSHHTRTFLQNGRRVRRRRRPVHCNKMGGERECSLFLSLFRQTSSFFFSET